LAWWLWLLIAWPFATSAAVGVFAAVMALRKRSEPPWLQEHDDLAQMRALKHWRQHGRRGIVAHDPGPD
jgi:hypothetical protein